MTAAEAVSLVGFKAQNHRQQIGKRGALEKVDDRRTPLHLWLPLNEDLRFTLDVAASRENTLCRRFYTVKEDGLAQSWADERVWCNPPYSDCGAWVEKAWQEERAPVVAMLLPANRTEQRWWQKWVEPFRDRPLPERSLTTQFQPGRMRFDVPDGTYTDPRGNRPPFGCVLLIWRLACA